MQTTIVCGPYELFRDSKKKTFCILEDNSISQRSYLSNKLTKQKNLPKSNNLTIAISLLEGILTHLKQSKKYSDSKKILGKRPAESTE